MNETPLSLLKRICTHADEESWKRLVDLYAPLLQRWLRQAGVDGPDADDLSQEVFAALLRELPQFEHNGQRGAFRHWLRSILVHRLRDFLRKQRTRPQPTGGEQALEMLDRLADPASELSRLWDQQHDTFIVRRLLELIEPEFSVSTWQAFRCQVLDGLSAVEAANTLGLSLDAIYTAKSRVLRRLRREVEGLTD